tara:strand:- start:372 stop:584 length:213 start_codon:yes stop_codon:yes gene_type:complete
MNNKDTIITLFFIASISYFSYKLGQGDPIVTEKIVEVEVMDKGFCMKCYKKHKWDEMYVIASEFEGFIYN